MNYITLNNGRGPIYVNPAHIAVIVPFEESGVPFEGQPDWKTTIFIATNSEGFYVLEDPETVLQKASFGL